MTDILDLRLNRTPIYYILEWEFENLVKGGMSYVMSLDDDLPAICDRLVHHNITLPYANYAFFRPERYLRARTLTVWIYDRYNFDAKHILLERQKIINSPALLPMIRRYD